VSPQLTASADQTVLLPVAEATSAAPARGRAELLASFPPRPAACSWPATQTTRAAMVERVLAPPFRLPHRLSQQPRRLAVLTTVAWLGAMPGSSWQQRWAASGAEQAADWRGLAASEDAKLAARLGPGLLVLVCADVIRPSLDWLLAFDPVRRGLAVEMGRTRDPDSFAAFARSCRSGTVGVQAAQQALTRIAVIMAAKGGWAADVTVGDCVELLDTAARLRAAHGGPTSSPLFYQLLHAHGCLGEDAPAAVRVFSGRGQPTCEELIDRYRIACRPIRDVLVDYLCEQQPTLDFSSLQRLAYLLGKLFWADLEAHHPGIDSLQLPREVAAAWKQRVMTRMVRTKAADGTTTSRVIPRVDGRSVMSAVRAFYLDVAEWAEQDPARWAPWAVRCPVRASDVSHKKLRLQRKARMDQRTRERLPVLPTLVAWVDEQRHRTAELLAAAEATPAGQAVSVGGQALRRAVLKTQPTTGRVWAEDPRTGRRRDLRFEEHRAFWTWAMVEVLRHTGIRIEELTELSHHSLVQYRLPATGELIPLLQITPSKTDAERLLVISPELADVLSTIIGRVRGAEQAVPPVVSYDKNERVYNPPMPLLFQFPRQLEHRALSERAMRSYLDHALAAIGVLGPDGRQLRYTFHDFRRLFITDAILHGMPPHIAQLVAGHRDINTTMGYKAVYPEEVINGHRAFIARRRALRPSEEYRVPTDEEWEEFLGHFERRKVALGDCGRSYATACIHEHACLRCPLLRPDPAQRSRLQQLHDNLLARIREAQAQRWLGEAEGLKVSLAGAKRKLAEMDQIAARRVTTVNLGIPTYTEAAGRTLE